MQGAKYMISKGCLENISQVWSFHNRATEPKEGLYVRSGEFLAGSSRVNLYSTKRFLFLYY